MISCCRMLSLYLFFDVTYAVVYQATGFRAR